MVRAAVDAFGRLDCAVNGAGILATPALLHELDLDAWQRTLAVNLTGVFLCLQQASCALMRAQGAGSIVNVSSGGGVLGTPALGHYCASKHGVLGLTKTAAWRTPAPACA